MLSESLLFCFCFLKCIFYINVLVIVFFKAEYSTNFAKVIILNKY